MSVSESKKGHKSYLQLMAEEGAEVYMLAPRVVREAGGIFECPGCGKAYIAPGMMINQVARTKQNLAFLICPDCRAALKHGGSERAEVARQTARYYRTHPVWGVEVRP